MTDPRLLSDEEVREYGKRTSEQGHLLPRQVARLFGDRQARIERDEATERDLEEMAKVWDAVGRELQAKDNRIAELEADKARLEAAITEVLSDPGPLARERELATEYDRDWWREPLRQALSGEEK